MKRDKKTIQTISPIDGSVVFEQCSISDLEVDRAMDLATKSANSAKSLTLDTRKEICQSAIDYLSSNRSAIAEEICRQMGRPIVHSANEIDGVYERASHLISISDYALDDIVPKPIDGFKRYIRREPRGVVLIVAPWNYPMLTITNALIPALLAGNSVVLKPSTQTPLSAHRFIEAFQSAGLPEGVLQCLPLSHNQTETLVGDKKVDFLCFTGSVEAGRKLATLAAPQFLGTGLELGGKDPAYVLEDADLDYCVEQLVDGAFYNAGQSCCGVERIYVHKNLYPEFIERYTAHVGNYVLGNPLRTETTLGPMVSKHAANFVRQQIEDACNSGARQLIHRENYNIDDGHGAYLAPQVLVNVDHRMSIMRDESFGPVVGIVAVQDDEEAVSLMNDSNLGLTASFWTKDAERAEALGARVETGTVFMNRCDYLDPALAWTGVKDTGMGISLSSLGFQQLTRAKSFHLKL